MSECYNNQVQKLVHNDLFGFAVLLVVSADFVRALCPILVPLAILGNILRV